MTGFKIRKIQKLHLKVIHAADHEAGYSDYEYLQEDKLIKQCKGALLTMICESCFPPSPENTPDDEESETNFDDRPSVVDDILAAHGLRWRLNPYRIETARGHLVSKGPRFDLTDAGLERLKAAKAQARHRAKREQLG